MHNRNISSKNRQINTVTSIDGTLIAYERSGSGPPLVLVPPGGSNDHTRWEAGGVLTAFAKTFTVYAMDNRGLGMSGDGLDYDLEREFEDVAAVVDSIPEPAILLGHSFGAFLSLEAALRTENLRALVLYEPPIPVGGHELVSEKILDEMTGLLAKGEQEEVLLKFLTAIAGIPPEEVNTLRKVPNWQNRVKWAHTLPRQIRGVREYAFAPERFQNLTTPTLLLTGSQSPLLYRDATAAVNKALPNSRLIAFEGHGHLATLTATERFIEAVTTFIHGLD